MIKIYSTNFDQCHVTMNHKDYSNRQQNDHRFLQSPPTVNGCEQPIHPAPGSVPAPRRSAPRSAPSFSATPVSRSAPLQPIFGPLRSVLRSAHNALLCLPCLVDFLYRQACVPDVDLTLTSFPSMNLCLLINKQLYKCFEFDFRIDNAQIRKPTSNTCHCHGNY